MRMSNCIRFSKFLQMGDVPTGGEAMRPRSRAGHLWKEQITWGGLLVLHDEIVTKIFTISKGGVELRNAA